MAETLTIDPTPSAEVVDSVEGVQLTADEKDSLALGEQMVDQQDALLAGKYKNAEELESAYIELQKKLGEDGKEENKAEAEQEEVLPEESEEGTQEFSPAAELITSASSEFAESGELTEETLSKFSEMSSADLVNAYMEISKNAPEQTNEPAADLSDAEINTIQNSVGGETAYKNLVNWAQENVAPGLVEAFDNAVNTASPQAIQLMVNGLKASYDEANGYEGRTLSGKPPTNTQDVFRSQPELVAAMSDPRYDNDPAFRMDVMEKLERSDNLNF